MIDKELRAYELFSGFPFLFQPIAMKSLSFWGTIQKRNARGLMPPSMLGKRLTLTKPAQNLLLFAS